MQALPLNATERTGPGYSGLPDPMADVSMASGFMAGWRRIGGFTAETVVPGGEVADNGRVDLVEFDIPWPLAIDVLRVQIPFDFLASCYPLAEWVVTGVPLLTVTRPTSRTLTKAGDIVGTEWALPAGASALASLADDGLVDVTFNTSIDAAAAGWTATNGSGVCGTRPFGQAVRPYGVVVEDHPAGVMDFAWDVPCAPGAKGYYLTITIVVSYNVVRVSRGTKEMMQPPVYHACMSSLWLRTWCRSGASTLRFRGSRSGRWRWPSARSPPGR